MHRSTHQDITHIFQISNLKLVGDKDVRPRDMRSDHQTQSLHYFHTYAVADRVDSSGVSDERRCHDVDSVQLNKLLPNSRDEAELM